MSDRSRREGLITVDELRTEVGAGTIDTVIIALPDMQGRLQGKRLTGRFFLDEVLEHDTEGCNYLLAVDVEMNTVGGYAMSSWESGYGDFVMRPDLATLRRVPWHDGTVLLMCDLLDGAGQPVVAAPRNILRAQSDRLQAHGWRAMVGTELEFLVFRDTYEDAFSRGYQHMTPANQYNVDYSILGTSRVEPLLRRIRQGMDGAGMRVESAKGECNLGQHEIAFLYDEALITCDNHSIYKTGSKEIAAQDGMSLTFMAKYDEREGSSCHIHMSLGAVDGPPAFAGDGRGDRHGFSPVFEHFLAGQLHAMRELTLFYAPNINSYKRFVEGSFAPTAIAWGRDNRTCALRIVGHSPSSLRLENRVPGADTNPYLAVSAMIAAGLYGVEHELELPPAFTGNAYTADFQRLPTTLREALELWEKSDLARTAFGDEVVAHYANYARVELAAFERSVTDWERVRGFERL
ncbi:MAG: glutamine synthetase [Actinomycetota bacterium]|jgi:glutamine synthetase|nr:glutamine synthetase [Actinomycetota bacterium]